MNAPARDYADTLVADSDLPTDADAPEWAVPALIYPSPGYGPSDLSGETLMARSNLHSELRQLREIDADLQLLDRLGPGTVSLAGQACLADEWTQRRRRVTDALAALDAALAKEGQPA